MKKLTGLSKPIFNLDGQPLTEIDGKKVSVGSIIANALARGNSEEPVRAMSIALKIYNAKEEIELEDADSGMIKEAISKDQIMNNLAKAAVLVVLEEK